MTFSLDLYELILLIDSKEKDSEQLKKVIRIILEYFLEE